MSEQHPSERTVWQRLFSALTRHLGYKILAIVIAVILWAGLIVQDPDITREKTFTGVSVSVSGEETMKRNGYIVVSDLDAALSDVSLRVNVPQMQYTNATAAAYNVSLNLSRLNETGTQEVRITTTNSSTYGTVSEVSPSSIEVEVEEYVSRYRIPVTVIPTGEAPEGYYATAPAAEPTRVTVSGPRSQIENVVRAEATLDLSQLPAREGTVRTAVGFRLVDSDGNEVSSDFIQVTSESVLLDTITAEQALYPYTTLDVSGIGLVTGEPAEGYEVKGVSVSPSTLIGAGRSEALALLGLLFTDTQIDVTGLTGSTSQQLRLRKPSELQYLSADSISVAVDIGPVITERNFPEARITLTGVASNLRGRLDSSTASVTLRGEQLALKALRANSVTLACDASGLTAGTWDLPILCTVPGFEATVLPATMRVTLTER